METASEVISVLMNADAVRLFKEVEDRAHGTPKQAVELAGDPERPVDGGASSRVLTLLEQIAERRGAAG